MKEKRKTNWKRVIIGCIILGATIMYGMNYSFSNSILASDIKRPLAMAGFAMLMGIGAILIITELVYLIPVLQD